MTFPENIISNEEITLEDILKIAMVLKLKFTIEPDNDGIRIEIYDPITTFSRAWMSKNKG